MYIEYNANPENHKIPDCQTRALAKFLNIDYVQASLLLDLGAIKKGSYKNLRFVVIYVLEEVLGLEVIKASGTVRKYAQSEHNTSYMITSNHAIASQDGKYYDTFDSGNKRLVYTCTVSKNKRVDLQAKINILTDPMIDLYKILK